MRSYQYILFDLDGTLTDSAPGIIGGVAAGLSSLGITGRSEDDLRQYAGPPLTYAWAREKPGVTEEESNTATKAFRSFYNAEGWKQNAPYPGALDCLKTLHQGGLTLATASSKPEFFVERICGYFGFAPYFTLMCGGDIRHDNYEKADVIRDCMKRLGDIPADQTVLVGDRCYDVEGGHLVGIDVIGVTFGYGGRAELEAAGADGIVDSFQDLCTLLLKKA